MADELSQHDAPRPTASAEPETEHLRRNLREAHDRAAATAEILALIHQSPADSAPVVEAIVQAGARSFPGAAVAVALPRGEQMEAAAIAGAEPDRREAWRSRFPFPLTRDYMHSRALLDACEIDIPDVAVGENHNSAGAVNFLASGFRAVTMIPLMQGDAAIGVLSLVRPEPGSLTPEQLEQIRTFAAQASIAIENTRTLNELRARTEALERSYEQVRAQTRQLEAQSEELRELNQTLEQRVAEQVAEIQRVGRLRRFLPPQVADLIVSTGEEALASHRREISALFCDLRGFTAFAETADPEDVMALLGAYHAAIGEIVHRRGGTLERFVGDGAMIIFNDPAPMPDHPLQAVLMALEMRDAVTALIARWSRMGHALGFGVGVARGFATLGQIGYEGRFDYAAIGTVANVASRLCDEAAAGEILITARVMMEVEDRIEAEPGGALALKGITRPVEIFHVKSDRAPKR